MSTKPQPKKLYSLFTKRDGIVVARDANPAKPQDLRPVSLKPNNKDTIKVDGIVVSVSSSSCTLESTAPKSRKKSGDDSPGGGRSWHSGGVVNKIGGPFIPVGGEMSNINSTPTTVGSSATQLVTVVKDKKKKSSGGYKCSCGCGGYAPKDGYTLKCAKRLGKNNDPHGTIIKEKNEKKRIKRKLMAEERLAAAGLSVNEDEHGVDVIQALVLVITSKKVTAYPEVHKSLLHHMPTLFKTKTPTLGEAIEMSGTALYVGYTGQDDMDEESFRFLAYADNPVLLKMDGSSISWREAKKTFGFASSVVFTCKSKFNARNVEAALQTHWEDLKFGYRRLWRENDKGAKNDSIKDVGKAHTVFLTISPLVRELVDGGKLQINN